jgi:predicted N-acetyltransferase YhbS
MQSEIKITIQINEIKGEVQRPMLAELSSDNEENAVRLAEQLVREAFRRLREQ